MLRRLKDNTEVRAADCGRELEGIVANKHRVNRYLVEDGVPPWAKISNRRHSQLIGRDHLFERKH